MRVCVWAHIRSIRLFKYYFHTANLTLNLPFANFTFSYRRQNRIPYGQRINHGTWNDKNEWFRAIGSSWWISPNIFGYWHRLYHITNRFPFSVKRVSRTYQIGAQYGCVCVLKPLVLLLLIIRLILRFGLAFGQMLRNHSNSMPCIDPFKLFNGNKFCVLLTVDNFSISSSDAPSDAKPISCENWAKLGSANNGIWPNNSWMQSL